jgi:hypothetical protein
MTENKKQKREPLTHEEFVEVMLQNEGVYKALAQYELDDGQLDEKQYAKIRKLASYELDKSTGEVVRLFDD